MQSYLWTLNWKTFQEIIESKNKIEEQFQEGVFIKPCKEGSSIDIIKVTDFSKSDLEKIKVDLVDRERKFLVERFIEGREFTVGFLNEHILEPLEIITKREFYDYEAKYDDDETQIIKADLDKNDLDTLKKIAKNCFNVFGLSRWTYEKYLNVLYRFSHGNNQQNYFVWWHKKV